MSHSIRSALALIVSVASIATLAGCTALFGPARDADGRVTETSTIRSTTLLEGDCFSFIDLADLTDVSVTPCAEPHTHRVIGQGELSQREIDDAGGVQNAVSASCKESFEVFKAAAEGYRPEQEFIVATEDRDGVTVTTYRCIATDGP